jgi:hypothetical protein
MVMQRNNTPVTASQPQPFNRHGAAMGLRVVSSALAAAGHALQEQAMFELDPSVARPKLRLSVLARNVAETFRQQANLLEREAIQ